MESELYSIDEHQIRNSMFVLAECMPIGIVIVDSNGNIFLCNSELEKMFGYAKGELIGKSIDILTPQTVRSSHQQMRHDFEKAPQKRQMGAGRDLRGRCKDGREIPVEIGLNPIQFEEGQFILASLINISARKQIESKLKKTYEDLQQKNEEMEQFVYSISHDLRAPLVTSTSYIRFLKEDLAAKNFAEVEDSIIRLEGANKRIQEFINDLLHFNRLGRISLDYRNNEIKPIINEIIENNIQLLEKKQIDFQIDEDFPAVKGDRKRISQAFENLILNAVKYGSETEFPIIRIFSVTTENEIQFCVKDNGPGIDPQYHQKIFALFQRLHTDKEGTGVGLTIVARVMQLHGGRTWVNSDLGKGAEFWLAFPKEPKKDDL
jgi:PAS domain S-box-containing protein